jgi:hypothetical protein
MHDAFEQPSLVCRCSSCCSSLWLASATIAREGRQNVADKGHHFAEIVDRATAEGSGERHCGLALIHQWSEESPTHPCAEQPLGAAKERHAVL